MQEIVQSKDVNVAKEANAVDINTFLKDPVLVEKINNRINAYNSRNLPKKLRDKGLRFKRRPEDNIRDAGNFNAMWFIDEFIKITSRTSNSPRSIRDCVEAYVVTSMQELYYENLKKQDNGNQEESRGESAHTE